ncbi:MAG: ion channel [Bacteroidia bacterium]
MAKEKEQPSENAEGQGADLGFGNQLAGSTSRLLNQDGSFNIKRTGLGFRNFHLYNYLISISWARFLLWVFIFFILLNATFALLYMATGINGITGHPKDEGWWASFLYCFYFSTQTFTTVGYGAISPQSHAASLLSSFEAMVGLMGFAFATGLLYGRFSRPTATVLYSDKMLAGPYKDDQDALMFRIVNARSSQLINLHVEVIMSWFEDGTRMYRQLGLERDTVTMFPLNWTIVHPVDEESPIWNFSLKDLQKCDPEFMVIINGYDDTFAQNVHARGSYRSTDVVWGARFVPMYHVDAEGQTVLEIDKLSLCEAANLVHLKN